MTTSQARIVWLDARANADERTVGPKAFGLVRMSRIGLKVPAGFCITADAYREHVETNGISRRISSVWDSLASASLEEKRSILREIRETIAEAPLDQAMRRAIETHYHKLGANRVAVRSSATAEDLPGQSFAGQYDTYLGIADLDECLAAVKQCWASLWTERAWDYRRKNGFDRLDIGMAVLVQSLVAAEASGVLFTADPTTGRSDRIIVEACFGLGDALVSGRVTPDRLLIAKRDLRLISQTVSQKKMESVPGEWGAVREQPVVSRQMSSPSIDQRTALKLAKFARKAERRFGRPQDMEWVVHGRDIFFVQSRPITTLPPPRSWEQRQVWTNANLGEVAPDVMTPMTYSVILTGGHAFMASALRLLGIDFRTISRLRESPLADLIAGRIYFNVNTCLGMIRGLPGGRRINFGKLFGGAHAQTVDLARIDIPEEDIPDLKFSTVRMLLRLPWSLHSVLTHGQRKGRISLQELRAKNDQLRNLNLSRMSEEQLAAELTSLIRHGMQTFDVLYGVVALAPLPILYKIGERWLGDTHGTLVNGLMVGMGNMDSAAAGMDLWRLALKARENPRVEQVIRSEESWQTAREKIRTAQGGNPFLEDWDRFMVCHGHHCRGEIELYNQRWSETPDYVLRLVRSYVTQMNRADPATGLRERTRERRQLEERCRRQLRNPVKRAIFNRVLVRAQNGAVFRENLKSEATRWLTVIRRVVLEIGGRLADRGVLRQPDDIFFLQLQELGPARQDRADFDVRTVVHQRRAEHENNKSILPPKVILGKFDPAKYVPDVIDKSVGTLKGLAASAGVVTGKARVILRSDTDEQLGAGEILVAPFTDAGWTPYFVPAAGIVIEQGGLLSHGSIIAREYGIPAVVNVPAATKIIRTGQTLRVDGDRGMVTILR